MNFQDIILKKRNGLELNAEEINFVVKGLSDSSLPDYQIAAWAMAVFFRGMSEKETRQLAMAMAYSGEVIDLSPIAGIKVDKHSTGGVGDKTTMVVIPLVAAAGVPVAKMSGRGLGHTGGTIDKFESIPGFQVEKSYSDFIDQVNLVKAAVVSQSGNLVPADKKLYAIRDVTATVDSIPLIASSVMSKKIACGADAIVLDVKVGSGGFMKDRQEALKLARLMIKIGREAGRKVAAVLSDMSEPLGRTVGNALEVREAIDTLQGRGPSDLEYLSLYLAAQMILLGGKAKSFKDALNLGKKLLANGAGLAKFEEMVAAQGGRLNYTVDGYGLPASMAQLEVKSEQEGYVQAVDAFKIGHAAMLLGAGRQCQEDVIDHAAGIELLKKRGDWVARGDVLAVLHSNDRQRIEQILPAMYAGYRLGPLPPDDNKLIIATVYE